MTAYSSSNRVLLTVADIFSLAKKVIKVLPSHHTERTVDGTCSQEAIYKNRPLLSVALESKNVHIKDKLMIEAKILTDGF